MILGEQIVNFPKYFVVSPEIVIFAAKYANIN